MQATADLTPADLTPADLTPADFLAQHKACEDGAAFAMTHATMAEVWDACPRVDWMFWICARLGIQLDAKTARLFACYVVRHTPISGGRTVWDLLTDERSRNAVVVAERFANGEATEEERKEARSADAAAAYAAAAAAYAADAAAAAGRAKARSFQADHLRSVMPNPFRNT